MSDSLPSWPALMKGPVAACDLPGIVAGIPGMPPFKHDQAPLSFFEFWPPKVFYFPIALMWRGGCIIRSAFLDDIKKAFDAEPGLVNLMLAPFFKKAIENAQAGWRRVAALAIQLGIPTPAIGAALAYYDGYRTARLPANLLQAQRDYFGAHTYERVDKPRGLFFHTNWTGHGGATASSAYDV
jgi:6-phosphogluconate dehydrogenase